MIFISIILNSFASLKRGAKFIFIAKKLIITSIVALGIFNLNSQDLKIVAQYTMNINLGQIKQLNSELVYAQNTSFYFWNNTENSLTTEADDFGNSKFYLNISDSLGTVNKVDFIRDTILTRSLRLDEILILHEKRENINWTLLDEEKFIGRFKVNKAEGDFRGRTYTAWYALEIPVKIGPWKLNGLPGMILEACDNENVIQIFFKSIDINSEPALDYSNIFNNGNYVSLSEYEEKQNSLANDMVKKIMAKMPRGATISVDEKTEIFLEREFND